MSKRRYYRPKSPRRPKSYPQPVSKILGELFQRHNLEKPLRIFEIQRQWPALVGEPTASRSWPTSLQRGVLIVQVADSTWVQELTYMKAQLLAKVQSVVSAEAVSQLRFYVRAGASSPEPEEPQASVGSSSEDPLERPLAPNVSAALDAFENELDRIEDPDLRRSVRRAFVEHLLRQ